MAKSEWDRPYGLADSFRPLVRLIAMSASSLRGQVRTWYLTCRTPMADATWAIGFGAPSLLTEIEKRGVGKDHVFLRLG